MQAHDKIGYNLTKCVKEKYHLKASYMTCMDYFCNFSNREASQLWDLNVTNSIVLAIELDE